MPVAPLLHAAQDFIHRHKLIQRGEKIIAAVSGGLDSMALLDILDVLRNEWMLELAVAHINHQLRGEESNDDEQFVRAVAEKRGVACCVHRVDTRALADARKQSIQVAARDVRYTFFTDLRTSLGFQKIATAHHADDNAETLLFNIFRGAGVNGLSGIPVIRNENSIIRPLLFATRNEIQEYVHGRGLQYREDSSNVKSDYTRNFIRHHVIPQIREHINPNLTATLLRTSRLFNELEDYLEDESRKLREKITIRETGTELIFDATEFSTKPLFLQEYVLLNTARVFSEKETDSGTVREMMKIISGATGDSCTVAKNVVLYRNRNELIFRRLDDVKAFRFDIEVNTMYEFDEFSFNSAFVPSSALSNNPYIEYVDAGALGSKIVLRSWQDGDWFIPLGMKDKKKLSDFFIDEKIPLFEKNKVPILESEGRILWVCGKRLDDRCKISSKTQRILKFEYHPRDQHRA
ncbi:MAG: tRNA lysidine(34) synthetase TilS [Ignavibacteriae bacterium]|nr:tRNA lysidine(34) synthetase TilS [Ignavibacteria bacterium]MBI3364811.1 tRNA lysidine(34) synthetase TilS [Ignavibacteriota bacterium]